MWIFLMAALQAENTTLIRQLSARDGAPSCTVLAEQTENIQKELLSLISSDAKPSYVPMRAANCLLDLYPSDVAT